MNLNIKYLELNLIYFNQTFDFTSKYLMPKSKLYPNLSNEITHLLHES